MNFHHRYKYKGVIQSSVESCKPALKVVAKGYQSYLERGQKTVKSVS